MYSKNSNESKRAQLKKIIKIYPRNSYGFELLEMYFRSFAKIGEQFGARPENGFISL